MKTTADLKPRGVKPMLSLIPWSAVPEHLVPPLLVQVAKKTGYWDDGSEYVPLDPQGPRLHEYLAPLIKAVGLEEIARAFKFGADKYGIDNWKSFAWDESADLEYRSAVQRHLMQVHRGEACAPDSGVRHEAHAAAGLMIMQWHYNRERAAESAAPEEETAAREPSPLAQGARVKTLCALTCGGFLAGTCGIVTRRDGDTYRIESCEGEAWWYRRDQLGAL